MRRISDEISSGIAMNRANARERGFVLVTMTVSAIALMGVVGLGVDIGRMYIAKNETQAYCDSAALAATLALDGTTAGITAAQTAVTNSANTWNLNTTSVSNPTVTFATASAGPWVANPNPATGYRFTRVTATVPLALYFLPVVVPKTTQNVVSTATAGQIDVTSLPRGISPYSAVSTNTTGPNFGLVVGQSYSIQWPQFNDMRHGCNPGNPEKCFNRPPCDGDPKPSMSAVVSNWGSENNGYWGSNSNSIIQQQVLDLIPLQPAQIGQNIDPVLTNGNKAAQAVYLDERVSQDTNTTDNTVSAYLSSVHNGRRLLPVPVVNPMTSSRTDVTGYGQFLLLADGPGTSEYYKRTTNGNDPFCAIYAGPYTIGSINPGVGSSTGASTVRLVQ